jgi:hypothetical protein
MNFDCQVFLDTATSDSDLVQSSQSIETYEPRYRPQIKAFRYKYPLTEQQREWLGSRLIDEFAPTETSWGFFRVYSHDTSCPSEEGIDIIGVGEGCWLTKYPMMKNFKCHSDSEFHKQFAKMQTKGRPIVAIELGKQMANISVEPKPTPSKIDMLMSEITVLIKPPTIDDY